MEITDKRSFLANSIEELVGHKLTYTDDTPLIDLDLDSLDIVELQMMFEDATGVMLEDPTEPILTIGDLLKIME